KRRQVAHRSIEQLPLARHHQHPRRIPRPRGAQRYAFGRKLEIEQLNTHGVLRSEEHTSELQSRENLVCRLLLEKKKNIEEIPPKKLNTDEYIQPASIVYEMQTEGAVRENILADDAYRNFHIAEIVITVAKHRA